MQPQTSSLCCFVTLLMSGMSHHLQATATSSKRPALKRKGRRERDLLWREHVLTHTTILAAAGCNSL